jgi:hypothetical protein
MKNKREQGRRDLELEQQGWVNSGAFWSWKLKNQVVRPEE